MSYGGRFALPIGTEREQTEHWEEVTVPPPTAVPPKATEKPVLIKSLPPLARGCFPGYTSLNRMQSVVHPIAMGTNENMLVCAPTGAGKTDVALMTIIRVLQSHVKEGPSSHSSGFTIDKDKFKVIYVAPMKALAAEITRKFGKKLAWLGIKVRELTGDMQMTRQEIAETQVIVTTPEKWDVVTRKPTGEGELASVGPSSGLTANPPRKSASLSSTRCTCSTKSVVRLSRRLWLVLSDRWVALDRA